MATIKHLCGVRVKLVHTTDGKPCNGCVFYRGPGNRCKPFLKCIDILMQGKDVPRDQWDNPNIAAHWEFA